MTTIHIKGRHSRFAEQSKTWSSISDEQGFVDLVWGRLHRIACPVHVSRAAAKMIASQGPKEFLSSSSPAFQMPTRSNSPLPSRLAQKPSPTAPTASFLSSDASRPSTTRAPTPINSDDDEEFLTEDEKRCRNLGKRMSTSEDAPKDPSQFTAKQVWQEARPSEANPIHLG
jgi:hypothetical protein